MLLALLGLTVACGAVVVVLLGVAFTVFIVSCIVENARMVRTEWRKLKEGRP